jgi:hypothetical protein
VQQEQTMKSPFSSENTSANNAEHTGKTHPENHEDDERR